MRTSFFLSALAAGLVLGGCATKSAGAGAGDEALGDGYYGDDGLSVDPNLPPARGTSRIATPA